MKEVRRSFAMSDNDMLTSSKTLAMHAKEDFAELKKVDPTLTMEIVDNWILDIDEGLEDFSSLQTRSNITSATNSVNAIMEECKNELQLIYYHVEQEFTEKSGMAIEFGRRGVEKARKNPEKMISLLSLIISVYSKPEITERLKKRFPVDFKEKVEALKKRLSDANVLQSVAKSNQPAETECRLTRYNAIWAVTRNVSEIAKLAFRDSYAKLQQYKLYDTPSPKTETPPAKNDLKSATNDQNSAVDDTTPEE